MSYKIKLRQRAVRYKEAGHSTKETIEAFQIGKTTLYKLIKMNRQGNLSDPKPASYIQKIDPQKL